jgi:hypothetical protein
MRKFTFLFSVLFLMAFACILLAQTNVVPASADDFGGSAPMLDGSVPSGKAMITGIVFFVGCCLKKSPVKDWMIPFILVAVGAIFACLLDGWSGQVITRGIYCSCGAIAGHQLIKQLAGAKSDAAATTPNP